MGNYHTQPPCATFPVACIVFTIEGAVWISTKMYALLKRSHRRHMASGVWPNVATQSVCYVATTARITLVIPVQSD